MHCLVQYEEITRGTPFADPATIRSRDQPRPRAAHKLSLNPSSVTVENAPPMTPKQSGQNGKQSVSPNIKEICQNSEIDNPEKELLIKKGDSDNNGVTGLYNSHPRVIGSQSFALASISFKDLSLLYKTTGGSLNILLSNGCC